MKYTLLLSLLLFSNITFAATSSTSTSNSTVEYGPQFQLGWDRPALDEVHRPIELDEILGYQLEVQFNGAEWISAHQDEYLSNVTTTFTVSPKEKGDYCFRIRATNIQEMASKWSIPVCGTIDAAAPAVIILNLTTVNNITIKPGISNQ